MNDNCATFDDLRREWCEEPKVHDWRWEAKHIRGGSLAKQLVAQLDALHEHRSQSVVLDAIDTLERRFLEQAEKWSRETEHLSSPSQIMMHPSYQAILGMSQENPTQIINLMLRDLIAKRRPWFWALSYLTKENPIRLSDAGRLDKMIQAWAEWGRQRGIL